MAKSATYTTIVALGAELDKTFGPTMKQANKIIGSVGGGIATAGKVAAGGLRAAVAGTAMLGGVALKSAADMQSQMANIGTLLNGTADQVEARLGTMQKEILSVSNTTGLATADLTAGMYQVVSAYGDSTDASKQLDIAAKAAVAGNATTTDSINMISAVTKGYGDTSVEAQQKVADLAFQTVKLGQTTYPELAASMGEVVPLANTMKISQEELFGATATLTGVTGNTAEVMTQLQGTIQGFLQPTAQMSAAISQLGYANAQTMMESLGFQGSLEALKDTVNDDEVAFANLFGSIEAKSAVLALTGEQAEKLTTNTQAMSEAAGAADTAFGMQTNTLKAMFGKMINLGKNAATIFGTALLPPVIALAEKAMPYLEKGVASLSVAIEKISPIIGKMFGGMKSSGFFTAMSTNFKTLATTVGPPVLSLFKTLGSTILPPLMAILNTFATKIWPMAIASLQKIIPVITPIIGKIILLGGKLLELANVILPAIYTIWISYFEGLFIALAPVLDNVVGILIGLTDFLIGVFTGDWEMAWQGIQDIVRNIFGGIVNLVKAPLNAVISMFNSVFSSIGEMEVPDWVPGIGGKTLPMPQLPMLAKGTPYFQGGAAIVGERGPELVSLPRGSAVHPASKTQSILSTPQKFGSRTNSFNATIPITINGPITKEQIKETVSLTKQELKKMLAEIEGENRRKSFAG